MKCENCIHSESSAFTHNGFYYVVCTLTREAMKTDVVCNCYNRDLSEYDICYKNRHVDFQGKRLTIAEFARVMNIDKNHAWYYVDKFDREVANG